MDELEPRDVLTIILPYSVLLEEITKAQAGEWKSLRVIAHTRTGRRVDLIIQPPPIVTNE